MEEENIFRDDMNRLKAARCKRCGHVESVRYADRKKKFCRICAEEESILEFMYLILRDDVVLTDSPHLESDCFRDWDENFDTRKGI